MIMNVYKNLEIQHERYIKNVSCDQMQQHWRAESYTNNYHC